MPDIQPLETVYKRVRFRSRLEARWAIYFDALGIAWEYEREAFPLPSGNYLPDFWLPQVRMWAEVKPYAFDEQAIQKCRELCIATGWPVLLLNGAPADRSFPALEKIDRGVGEVDYVLDNQYIKSEHRFWCGDDDGPTDQMGVAEGVEAARAARFDDGVYRD